MNYEKQFENLKSEFDKIKNLRVKAEATLEQLEIQKKQLENELEKLNINPEHLEEEINKLEKEIAELFDKADKMMPRDIIKGESDGRGR